MLVFLFYLATEVTGDFFLTVPFFPVAPLAFKKRIEGNVYEQKSAKKNLNIYGQTPLEVVILILNHK